ncbi:motility associated factor glycosyltransferase family protein [Campylobacter coli]|nr:motility associated factor glycosyltransferase family protein [Campylobacter coli]EED2627071.1 motility associated factor glycosyltransferase family protein [Campylobacter coli]
MTFSQTQQELFNKNLENLSNIFLKEKLLKIKESKFEFILGKDSLDINLKNKSDNTFLYENVIEELNSMLNIYNDKYLLYPVLYFYGFGNGILFKALTQNKHLKHIVVFEKDLEILWMMFHVLDFSKELKSGILMVLDIDFLTMEFFSNFCSSKPFFDFSRIYFLELTSNYYERYQEDILKINKNLAENFKNAIISHGNDPLDALQGIEQFVYNLPQMITHPTYKELLNKRRGLSKTAIIVSTGPSLTKQLPLLKKYQNKATIFCADSSYPILAKHNIKPDYVCMLERTELTAEFFNHDFGDFDKDIVFLIKSVAHPNASKYLNQKQCNFNIVSTYASFIQYLKLDHFGYFNMGFSVAHMAYYLCVHLNYKNVILIGQDLAYAENGNSHPSDYQNSATYETQRFAHISTLGYGGEKEVKTHKIWLMFKQNLEHDIQKTKNYLNITTYNCTEGGARIEGAIEKPFLWACENLLDKDLDKPFEKLYPLSKNKQDELMLKAYYRVYKSIRHCKEFRGEIGRDYNKLKNSYLKIQDSKNNEKYIENIIQNIDQAKSKIDKLYNTQKDLIQILGPLLTQFELNLARIYVLNPKTKEDSFNKSILWIKEHIEFLQMVYGHIEAQENALLKNIPPLEEELDKRNLNKWIKLIKERG